MWNDPDRFADVVEIAADMLKFVARVIRLVWPRA